ARFYGRRLQPVNRVSVTRARCYQSLGLTPDRFGDVAVLRHVLQVFGEEAREYAYGRRDGRAWIAREVVNNRIRARPRAIQCDDAQNFVRDGSHGGYVFNLLIRDARIVDE